MPVSLSTGMRLSLDSAALLPATWRGTLAGGHACWLTAWAAAPLPVSCPEMAWSESHIAHVWADVWQQVSPTCFTSHADSVMLPSSGLLQLCVPSISWCVRGLIVFCLQTAKRCS